MEHDIIPIRLDRGPVPLFHQIAESLRYSIATGRLRAGDRLPALRQAAESWGVNLHTVRRAYADLAAEGLVETRSPGGTQVVDRGQQSGDSQSPLDLFVARVVEDARRLHHLGAEDLALRIRAVGQTASGPPLVHFLECSLAQAEGHCRELEARWRVDARACSLDTIKGELPPGDVIATYFHYAEVKSRWPERIDAVRFVPIRPDASLADRILAESADATVVRLCEFDEAKVTHIASDLRAMMPDRLEIHPCVVARADELIASDDPSPILLSPRLWGALEPEQRTDSRLFEVRYIIDADSIDALGRHFNWAE